MSISQVNLSEARRALLEKQLQKARAKKTKVQTIARRPEGEPMVLSFAQQRLWFLHQWEPDSPAYNIFSALSMRGRLDVSALRQAFDEIVRRHQVLQMIYVTIDEEPTQVPHPNPTLVLETVDLSGLPSAAQATEVQCLTDQEASSPFDLARDLSIRTLLLCLGEEEHVLLLTIHHIATDGWSRGVLVKDLIALYQAYCDGKPSSLPELPIQYADFAYWQRNWLQGEVLDRQLDYWKRQLAGAPAVLELPTDRPRPRIRTSNGTFCHFSLSPLLTEAVKTLAQREGVTPFMTLLAAFQILLYRYSGQEDIVVGSPIANRNRSEIEGLIGFFVNTLALRVDLSGNPSVRELLRQVRETTLEAYAHQDVPFEKLVGELRPERSLTHTPLFQVMFTYQNVPRTPLKLPGMTIEYVDAESGATKFDLKLLVEEVRGEFECAFTCNTDLFDSETIHRMIGHFRVMLDSMIADPEQRVAELPILTPDERQQLLVEWTDTRTLHPQTQCLHQLFEEQVARTPGTVAVVFEDQPYTYRELNQRANQVAHYLQSLGVGPDVRVGLFMERSLDTLVALLGILKSGGAYVPLDPIYPQERIRFMLEDVQVSALVTQSDLATNLPGLGDIQIVCLDGDWDAIARCSSENPPITVIPSNLIYALFTSGSTGRPKGVAVEHRNYLNYYHSVIPRLQITPGMHFAMVSTFSTDLGTIQFWAPLTTGGTVHIISYERATDPEAMVDYFSQHTIDALKLVPSHFDALQGAPGSEIIVPRKLVIFTGEASQWETVAQVKALNPDCMIQDHYGVTETTCATLTYIVPDEMPKQHAATLPLGQPLGNVQIYILDSTMEPVPIGIAGELYIGGAGVTRGYINRPALTAKRFVPDPHSREPGARLYRTGDLALYRPDGTVKLLGRMDHQVKIRGYRVETGEIETLLCEQFIVQDAVVVAREDAQGDKRLVAYVVPQPGTDGDFSTATLRSHLREQLPAYMVPTAFVPLDAIPLNPNGKVDRFALPSPEYARLDSEHEFVAPRNELETHIAACWSEVLEIEGISIDDNFFDVGGESFKAIRVVRRIGESVSVMDLFKYPTIRELAEQLDHDQPRSTSLLYELTRPVPANEKTLSLVCIPYGGGNAVMFQPVADALPKNYSLYAVQIPGHDYARRDEVLQPLEEVARQCAEEIKQNVSGPIALYGHCVGGAMAVEIARLLEEDGVEVSGVLLGGTFPTPRLPGKLFEWLAKVFPQSRWRSGRFTYEALRALGGFTDAIDPDEQEFMIRALRHDVQVAEDYYTQAYVRENGEKLQAPILCIVGQMDRASEFYEERFSEWNFFSDSVDLAVIPQAGHYFLKHQAANLASIVTDQLDKWQGETDKTTAQMQVAVAPRPTITPSLRTFVLVVLGQLVSLIGTSLTAFALGIWVYQQTGSVTDFAVISIFARLPAILLAPIAGAVVDRWDRRRVMILSDILGACSTLLVILLFGTNSLQIWHVYVITGISAIANIFQTPAYIASITQLVPKQYLGRANGIAQMASAIGDMLASLLGGMLLIIFGLYEVALIDLATFIFAVSILLLVRFPDTLFRRQEEPLLQEVVKGWQYIVKRHSLVLMIVFFVLTNFLISIIGVLITPLMLSFGSPADLGVVGTALGIGVLAGGVLMSVWGGTRRRIEGMIGFVALSGLSSIVIGFRPSIVTAVIGSFGIGFTMALINAHWQTLMQTKVGLELQGRVIATNRMLALSLTPLSFALAGPLADTIFEPLLVSDGALAGSVGQVIGVGPGRGMGLMVILLGAIRIIVALVGYGYRPLRFMEDELPDAIPDAMIVADKDELQRQADKQLLVEAA